MGSKKGSFESGAMPLPDITDLSDDDALTPKPIQSAKPDNKKATEPKKGEAKAKTVPKSAAKKAAAKSAKPKTEPKEKEEKQIKRPAAAAPKAVLKRPAAAPARAYKYMYHKHNKWGIKFGGHEILTAWPSLFAIFLLKLCLIFLSWRLSLHQVKSMDGIPSDKLEEIAESCYSVRFNFIFKM